MSLRPGKVIPCCFSWILAYVLSWLALLQAMQGLVGAWEMSAEFWNGSRLDWLSLAEILGEAGEIAI